MALGSPSPGHLTCPIQRMAEDVPPQTCIQLHAQSTADDAVTVIGNGLVTSHRIAPDTTNRSRGAISEPALVLVDA